MDLKYQLWANMFLLAVEMFEDNLELNTKESLTKLEQLLGYGMAYSGDGVTGAFKVEIPLIKGNTKFITKLELKAHDRMKAASLMDNILKYWWDTGVIFSTVKLKTLANQDQIAKLEPFKEKPPIKISAFNLIRNTDTGKHLPIATIHCIVIWAFEEHVLSPSIYLMTATAKGSCELPTSHRQHNSSLEVGFSHTTWYTWYWKAKHCHVLCHINSI